MTARAWREEGTRAERYAARENPQEWTAMAPVEAGGVALDAIAAGAPEPPFTLEVEVLPLPSSPLRAAAELDVPRGAALGFGYGLREQSWGGGGAVRFRVHARHGEGELQLLFDRTLDPKDPETHRWHDAHIDLSALAGRRVQLEFEASWDEELDTFTLPVFADPTVYVPEARSERPNVLLISLDTLRARSLGVFGYDRDTSPFIDGLAAKGALFESVMTTSATTAPSHMSLFTGLYPINHGLPTGLEWKRKEAPTLAGLLRDAGYETAAFTENGFVVRSKGFGEGFAVYVENRSLPERPRDARVTFGQARRWLQRNRREPFFVFVHTYEVHQPYQSPERYAGLFFGDGVPGPKQPVVREMRDAYDREIRYVDDELRSLLGTLREVGLADSTIVVITSDHGEEFGEHGFVQHGGTVYQEVLHVPLLFWAPGRVPVARIPTPVSLIDVVPTVLSLAGVPAPPRIDGVDLTRLMAGDSSLEPRRLFAEARAPIRLMESNLAVKWNPPLVAMRTGDQKFVVHRPRLGEPEPTRAYDLAADPDEQSPRVLEGAEKQRIEALVDRYLAGDGSVAPAIGDEGKTTLDPETAKQLRELGYLE
jgi:arylsulfatase A-like enzyme